MTRRLPTRSPKAPSTPAEERPPMTVDGDPWADLGRKHAAIAQAGALGNLRPAGKAVSP